MAETFLYILIGVLFILLFGVVMYLLITIFKKQDDKKDNPIAINFLSNIDSGYFIGEEIKNDAAKSGRRFIEMIPKDVDLNKLDEVKNVPVIVDKGKLISLPKGTASKYRNINIYLPPKAEDLSGPMKDTLIGKAMQWATEADNLVKTQIEIMRTGINRRDALALEIGTGELSEKFLDFTNNLVKNHMENVLSKQENKSNLLPRPALGSP